MADREQDGIEKFLAGHEPFEKLPEVRIGEMVGDWRVTAFLGRGATSEVYRAQNAVTNQIGAIKILMRNDAKAVSRFRREASLLADTFSPAFPRFYGAGEHDGRAYLAIELLEPADLPSSDAAVARYILGVCAGVQALHRRGYIHRDIKPRNVMRRPSTGEPVLIDMGLAKENNPTPQTISDTLSVVDGNAVGVGTVGYSAPEQFTGGKITAAMDVHALGMLANACFKSHPPLAWAKIIRRSTSSAPEQRYATVEGFVRAVRHRHWLRNCAAFFVCIAISAMALEFISLGMRSPYLPPDNDLQEVAGNLLSLGMWKYANGRSVLEIKLDGRDIVIGGEAILQDGQNVVVVGPGRLTADISGEHGASLELLDGATLVNLTAKPYPESAMKYIVGGTSYLNFKNLKPPKSDDIKNVWVNDMGGNGRHPIILFGGPPTRREAESAVGLSY